MAIQFPNFLSAPIRTPDYSSIADIMQNYYAGKQMPREDMINALKAKLAQPMAEQNLLSTKLANRKQQFELDQLQKQMQQNAEFEKQLRMALSGNMPNQNVSPSGLEQLTQSLQKNLPYTPIKEDQLSQNLISPQMMPIESQPERNEILITKGAPHLAGIDQLYESDPKYKQYLEQKGFKKTQDIKYDNKTGRTTVITKYPSGKVTQEIINGRASEQGIPLTNQIVTRHQQVVSAVDNLLPTLEELRDLPKHSNTYLFGNALATGTQKDYQRLVNAAKENIIRAFALNPTDSGLQTALDQLNIGGLETEKHYRKAIDKLIEDMKRRREYSNKELKKTNKIAPIDTSASAMPTENQYTSDQWEAI